MLFDFNSSCIWFAEWGDFAIKTKTEPHTLKRGRKSKRVTLLSVAQQVGDIA